MAEYGTNLEPITQYKHISEKQGWLHKAEMRVEGYTTRSWVNLNASAIDPDKVTFAGEMYFQGRLANDKYVKTIGHTLFVPIATKGVPEERWTQLVMDNINAPRNGDVLAVIWFSRKVFPQAVRGELYVEPLCLYDNGHHPELVYRRKGEFSLKYIRDYTKIIPDPIDGKDIWDSQAKDEEAEVRRDLSRKIHSVDDLLQLDPSQIMEIAREFTICDDKVLRFFQDNWFRMQDYKTCLAYIASFDVRRYAAKAVLKSERLPSPYACGDRDKIVRHFHEDLIDRINTAFANRSNADRITPEEVAYHIEEAMYHAVSYVIPDCVSLNIKRCFKTKIKIEK